MLTEPQALVIVDLQKDFCPGGSLAVINGDHIVPIVNELVREFKDRNWPVFFTRDWHPADHSSFQSRSGPWPPHCVAETDGARFHEDLNVPDDSIIIDKATDIEKDAYSGFDGTDLNRMLAEMGIKKIVVCGLATDYCVKATVIDAIDSGLNVSIISDAVKAVNVDKEDGEKALSEMTSRGAIVLSSGEWLKLEGGKLQ